ncbi:MAG: baseplate J/gp47 family protein [Polyangiaceae bacterium]|nr:baseplate J/gp47 family protein [Polyangiaceae bacterium]
MFLPTIDDRTYSQILEEALARVAVHNPEWTNFTESDPGVTLLQLFAFMAESLHYRANLIPERNRLKFLDLLQIPRLPPAAAQGMVILTNERGPAEVVTLSEELAVSAGPTSFVTRNGLDVLPVETRLFIKARLDVTEEQDAAEMYDELYSALVQETEQLAYYKTQPVEFPTSGTAVAPLDVHGSTVDGNLWLALLARDGEDPTSVAREIAGRTLTLGMMPAVQVTRRVLAPGGREAPEVAPPLAFSISTATVTPPPDEQPHYVRLDAHLDADPREELCLAQLVLPGEGEFGIWSAVDPVVEGTGAFPPALEGEDISDRVIAWIVIHQDESADQATALDFKLSWVGLNAVRVTQEIRVCGELVGQGTGEPDQQFRLVNLPVIASSLSLTVAGEPWSPIEDLLAAPPEVPSERAVDSAPAARASSNNGSAGAGSAGVAARVYVIDRTSGQIRFGDGLHGARPRGAIVASYAYGGGPKGNVGIGAINRSSELPSGFRVSNPVPTWGGSEGESVADAERRIPRVLRHRDRAVSVDDWKDILERTPGIALGRAEVLPLVHPDPDVQAESPGIVTVMVIPRERHRGEPPVPDRYFLDAVCSHLAPRRLLTTEVYVLGPSYVPIAVSVGIDVVPGYDIAPVVQAAKERIRRFLSPLYGGFEAKGSEQGTGWPLSTPVVDRELMAQVAREDGVAGVHALKLWKITSGGMVPALSVPLRGLELPYLKQISVLAGDAADLGVQAGQGGPTEGTAGSDGTSRKQVPVPVLPPEC